MPVLQTIWTTRYIIEDYTNKTDAIKEFEQQINQFLATLQTYGYDGFGDGHADEAASDSTLVIENTLGAQKRSITVGTEITHNGRDENYDYICPCAETYTITISEIY